MIVHAVCLQVGLAAINPWAVRSFRLVTAYVTHALAIYFHILHNTPPAFADVLYGYTIGPELAAVLILTPWPVARLFEPESDPVAASSVA